MAKTTSKLLSDLKNIKSFEDFKETNSPDLVVPDAIEFLLDLTKTKGITKADLVKKTCLERTYAYHILAGKKKPSRDKLLLFALAGNLDLIQTQKMLKFAGLGPLYARDKRDAAIIYAVNKQYSVLDTEQLLADLELESLLKKVE